MKDSLQSLRTKLPSWLVGFGFDVVTKWFFADIAYTLLPIAVIILMKLLTTGKIDFLFLSPEWSFATIVSFGTVITNLIELKTEYQHDPSHRLYTGTRLQIISLILATVTLSLVVLRSDGLQVSADLLWYLQIGLFIFSIASLFAGHIAKEGFLKSRRELPASIGRERYYAFIEERLNKTFSDLLYIRYALEKQAEMRFHESAPEPSIKLWEETRREELRLLSLKLEKAMTDVKPMMDSFLRGETTKENR